MAKFFIDKWTKERFPEIYKAQGNKEVYAVFYDNKSFPKIIGKALSLEQAKELAEEYCKNALNSSNCQIKVCARARAR